MKYIVLTSKHHDGFKMFRTRLTDYNITDATPYRKDVVKQLADACTRGGLKFGVYYSSIDWHYRGATTWTDDINNPIPKAHEDFNVGQLKELLSNYGQIAEIWFDMGKLTPVQSRRFADTVHKLQRDCMVSGRVFNHQGDFTVVGDNQIPDFVIDEPWQTPASIYTDTWGYRSWAKRDDLQCKIKEHFFNMAEVVSRGGNYLLNIGPKVMALLSSLRRRFLKALVPGCGQMEKRFTGASRNHSGKSLSAMRPPREIDFFSWCESVQATAF